MSLKQSRSDVHTPARRRRAVQERAENGSLEPYERNEDETRERNSLFQACYLTSGRLISANLTWSNKQANISRFLFAHAAAEALWRHAVREMKIATSLSLFGLFSCERGSVRLGQSGAGVCVRAMNIHEMLMPACGL